MSPRERDGIRVGRSVFIPSSELRWKFSRSGGPGGQNVNRRETQVELIFDVASSPSFGPRQRERVMRRLRSRLDSAGRLHLVASDARMQGANREAAVERLRRLLTGALRPDPPVRKPTKPGARARERRLKEKRVRSQRKRQRARPDEE